MSLGMAFLTAYCLADGADFGAILGYAGDFALRSKTLVSKIDWKFYRKPMDNVASPVNLCGPC